MQVKGMVAVNQLAPSRQVLRAAKQAADSSHALVNLIRLVQGLNEQQDSDRAAQGENGEADDARQAQDQRANIAFARALLDALREQNEQSSKTQESLREVDRMLKPLEAQNASAFESLSATTNPKSTNASTSTITRDATPISSSAFTSMSASSVHNGDQPFSTSTSIPTKNTTAPSFRRRIPQKTIEEYLAQRSRNMSAEGEEGLLPLKVDARNRTATQKENRDALLAGAAGGLGAAQIHEELGGQLADMSHQLKLNALKFADSLEAEKALLDASQNTLENNLTNTRSTKAQLSKVSKKSRGTTCMTFGVVVLVLVIFIWTYMLIRFT